MKLNMWKRKAKKKKKENPLEKARVTYQMYYSATSESETQKRCAYYKDGIGCVATTNETFKYIMRCRIEKEDALRKKNKRKIKRLQGRINTLGAEIKHLEGLRSKPVEVVQQLKESKAERADIENEIDALNKAIHESGEKITRYKKLESSVCQRCQFFTPERLLARMDESDQLL